MKRYYPRIIIFTFLMAVYCWTLAPGNFWADSGAFAACNEILGLPYSPSFPLYTLGGRVFNAILPLEPVVESNLYSAAATAAAGIFFFMIVELLLAPVISRKGLNTILALLASAAAFLTVPLWQSAVRTEVYALQLLITTVIIYLYLKALGSGDNSVKSRLLMAAIFFQGLSFANHALLALMTVPPVIHGIIHIFKRIKGRQILYMSMAALAAFVIAASIYLYLPVRANQDPIINSGEPKTLSSAIKKVTRTSENFAPPAELPEPDYIRRMSLLGQFVFDQTGMIPLLGALFGLLYLIRQKKWLWLFVMTIIPFDLALTVWAARFELANFDIVAYSGLAIMMLMALTAIGLAALVKYYPDRKFMPHVAVAAITFAAFFNLSGNLYACDFAGLRGPDFLARHILETAPPQTIIIADEEDTMLPLWYHVYARGERDDVRLILARALYDPTYRDKLRKLYPDLKYPVGFDAPRIDSHIDLLWEFCSQNCRNHPVMVEFGVFNGDVENLVPSGFLFRYIDYVDPDYEAGQTAPIVFFDSIQAGTNDAMTRDFVARAAFNFGIYCERVGRDKESLAYFQYAIDTDRENPQYLLALGQAALQAGDTRQAIALLQEATRVDNGCPEAEKILSKLPDYQ